MNIDSIMRLSAPMQILAAVGAELRLRQEGLEGDPRIRALPQEVIHT